MERPIGLPSRQRLPSDLCCAENDVFMFFLIPTTYATFLTLLCVAVALCAYTTYILSNDDYDDDDGIY